jgi:hypothetical protein
MVHCWISLRNNKNDHKSLKPKIINIFKNSDSFFYGDYDLDIYIGTKNDYSSLESVVSKVIDNGNGWIRNRDKEYKYTYYSLEKIISFFGDIDSSSFRKLFPRKEKFSIKKTIELRKDGNFTTIASETNKFYYVFCFATS